jgi:hypothetical protein
MKFHRAVNNTEPRPPFITAQVLYSKVQDLPPKTQQARSPDLRSARRRSYPADEVFRETSERADQEHFGAR